MSVHEFFASDYVSARAAFLAACSDAGIELASHVCPHRHEDAPGGLFTDVARVGRADAPNVVVVIAGTHGAEGIFGSGCQVGSLRQRRFDSLPSDTAILLIHAINPLGFAGCHRVAEDNVDLNRNFGDHARPLINPDYASVHDLLVPEEWTEETPTQIRAGIAAYIAAHGQKAFDRAAMAGQATHPSGIYYSGVRPTWSNVTLTRIAAEHLARAKRIAVLDLHTGLGPFASAELICRHPPGSEDLARARRWYGEGVTAAQAGESGSPPVDGNLRMAFGRLCPTAEITSIGVEIGTVPLDECLMILCADNWLYNHGDPPGPFRDRVRKDMRRAFSPDDPRWTEPVFGRTMELLQRAIVGVSTA